MVRSREPAKSVGLCNVARSANDLRGRFSREPFVGALEGRAVSPAAAGSEATVPMLANEPRTTATFCSRSLGMFESLVVPPTKRMYSRLDMRLSTMLGSGPAFFRPLHSSTTPGRISMVSNTGCRSKSNFLNSSSLVRVLLRVSRGFMLVGSCCWLTLLSCSSSAEGCSSSAEGGPSDGRTWNLDFVCTSGNCSVSGGVIQMMLPWLSYVHGPKSSINDWSTAFRSASSSIVFRLRMIACCRFWCSLDCFSVRNHSSTSSTDCGSSRMRVTRGSRFLTTSDFRSISFRLPPPMVASELTADPMLGDLSMVPRRCILPRCISEVLLCSTFGTHIRAQQSTL
mmetsp:Transcript_49742/g.115402  ORF Transcript_49742/g.115402 Transcript_49742/m.115402 type:complete len:340 (+) Transcript_49742:564-1583(+)